MARMSLTRSPISSGGTTISSGHRTANLGEHSITVVDETGIEYRLGEPLAPPGAQGVVHSVVGHGDLAVKLLKNANDLDRLRAVRRLPLDGIHVAGPTALIEDGDQAGYVMQLAGEMTTLSKAYLPRQFGSSATLDWYGESGGLSRRLAVAASIARTLASLHARSLAYVDLNPNNVMVSSNIDQRETLFIDADNLTSAVHGASEVLGLRGYLAPERARLPPATPSTLADSYSLAVVTFRMLCLLHPLQGEATEQADLDAEQADDAMDNGTFPYVADPDNDSNRPVNGSAIVDAVISPGLRKLCEQTFIQGRLNPKVRPSSSRWRDALFTALDNVITCNRDDCKWTYYRVVPTCPKCGQSTGAVPLLSWRPEVEGKAGGAGATIALSRVGATTIEPRHLWGRFDETQTALTLEPTDNGFEIVLGEGIELTSSMGSAMPDRLPFTPVSAPIVCRLTSANRATRFLRFHTGVPR